MEAFLGLNGYDLILDNAETYQLVIQVAQSEISKEDLTEFLTRSIAPR
jgi:death on curing protein